MRSIRLVVNVSSPVPSVDDETKMNVEKHESSLLTVVSDVGSTPTASAVYAGARFCQLYADRLPSLLVVVLHVVPPAVFALVHGSLLYRKGILVFTAICLSVAGAAESLSLRTGWPFGSYYFTGVMGPKVAQLPVLLVLAYLGIAYCSGVLSLAILGYRTSLRGIRTVTVPAAGRLHHAGLGSGDGSGLVYRGQGLDLAEWRRLPLECRSATSLAGMSRRSCFFSRLRSYCRAVHAAPCSGPSLLARRSCALWDLRPGQSADSAGFLWPPPTVFDATGKSMAHPTHPGCRRACVDAGDGELSCSLRGVDWRLTSRRSYSGVGPEAAG